MIHGRRSFMKYAALAAAGSPLGLQPFSAISALAQGSGEYKALVCIFLYGGNDANNLLVPGDAKGYANYAELRGALALSQKNLLSLSEQPSLRLNSQLPGVASLFNSKSAAFVTNVGSLVQPTTRAQYLAGSVATPMNLFSHGDQTTMWQTADPVSVGTTGWAGRIADSLGGSLGSPSIPMAVSVSGAPVFGTGRITSCVSVTPGSAIDPSCGETPKVCAARSSAAQELLSFNTGITLVQADQTLNVQANSYGTALNAALASAPRITTPFPASNPLSAQLEQILKIMSVRGDLNTTRQIFFASLGGFDTHSNQMIRQDALLSDLDSGLTAFNRGIQALGLEDQVTTFTMSEFGRALESNTSGGSDHAWGTHLIVMGGAVKGGNTYGTYPTMALGESDDSGTNGRWIPTTSSSQFAATLASWFGVSAGDMPLVFPYLSNFNKKNLGFV